MKKLITKIIKKVIRECAKSMFIVLSWLPQNKKLIMFESFSGKQYSCNPKAIYEYIVENHPEYNGVWSIRKEHASLFVQRKIPYVNRYSFKWFISMARARYWVTNSRMPSWITKPKHTAYVQTWHGTPLKKLVSDIKEVHMPGTTNETYVEGFHQESKNWDYLISPNRYSSDIFKRAFNFHKEMIEVGYPRNDIFYTHNNSSYITSVKEKLGLPKNKKIILYAPTWRDNEFYRPGKYKFELNMDLNLLKEKLGEEYIILLRLHSFVADNFDLSGYEGFVYNYSRFLDINELYLISDLLITDYSSVFFDFANLKRPIIFYTYDLESYSGKVRGLYFNLEEDAPGPVVKTTQELLQAISDYENNGLEAYEEKYNSFYQTYCYLENGFASKRVVEKIFLGEAK